MSRRTDDAVGVGASRLSVTVTSILLGIAALYFLLPVWWLIVAATKNDGDLFSTFGLWFAKNSLPANLNELFSYKDGMFVQWMLNSLLYVGVGAVVAALLSTAAGYALAKFQFRGKEAIFALILCGVLIPMPLLTIPMYLLASSVGLANTVWAVLVPAAVTPFGVFLARIYAESAVPDELLEAARIDGAGEVRTFFTIVLRIMSPAVVTILLFQAVAIWNNFFLPLVMLSNERLYPVTLGLYTLYQRPFESNYSIVTTGSLIAIIPLLLVFLLLQRYWRTGLAAGSLKA